MSPLMIYAYAFGFFVAGIILGRISLASQMGKMHLISQKLRDSENKSLTQKKSDLKQ